MFCIKCGKPIDDNVAFCKYCGAKRQIVQPNDYSANPGQQRMQTEQEDFYSGIRNQGVQNKKDKGGSNAVLIIFIVVLLLAILGVGGFFGYRFLSGKKADDNNVSEEKATDNENVDVGSINIDEIISGNENTAEESNSNEESEVKVPSQSAAVFSRDLYNGKINEYKSALAIGQERFFNNYIDGLDYNSINAFAIALVYNYGSELKYGYYDVNGDGIEELLFANEYGLIDTYTAKNGQVAKLIENGERGSVYALSDGRFLTEGSSGAAISSAEIYKLSDNGDLVKTEAFCFCEDSDVSFMSEYKRMSVDEYVDYVDKLCESSIYSNVSWINLTLKSSYEQTYFQSTSEFYGIWVYASQNFKEAVRVKGELMEYYFDPVIVYTGEWSNLGNNGYYAVSAGMFDNESDANNSLSYVKGYWPNAYVKYTGGYLGNLYPTTNNEYAMSESYKRTIQQRELNGLSAFQCKVIRNEIYARHGRMFVSEDMQKYFNSTSWYRGTIAADAFSDNMLTDIERENVSILETYESFMGYR